MFKKYQGLPEHSEYQQNQTDSRKVKAKLCRCSETGLTSVFYQRQWITSRQRTPALPRG